MMDSKRLATIATITLVVALIVSVLSVFLMSALFFVTTLLILIASVIGITSWIKSERGSNAREIIVACVCIVLLFLAISDILISSAPRHLPLPNQNCNLNGGICQSTPCEAGNIPAICTSKGLQCCRVIPVSG